MFNLELELNDILLLSLLGFIFINLLNQSNLPNKTASVNNGTINHGIINRGTINYGTINHGTINYDSKIPLNSLNNHQRYQKFGWYQPN